VKKQHIQGRENLQRWGNSRWKCVWGKERWISNVALSFSSAKI